MLQLFFSLLPWIALLLWACWVSWIYFKNHGAPFYPTYKQHTEDMLRLANIQRTDHVADLGCGDGRLVFAAAKRGAELAVGYEINLFWYLVCILRKQISPFGKNVLFHWGSYWKKDLSSFNVILIYQCQRTMPVLAEKLKKESVPGRRIVSNTFYFPDWPPAAQIGKVHLYTAPKNDRE